MSHPNDEKNNKTAISFLFLGDWLVWGDIVILIHISLMIRDIQHFSCVCWPFGCLFWKNVYLVSLLIFNQTVNFFFFFLLFVVN